MGGEISVDVMRPEKIIQKIYWIIDKKVMLDRDLTRLYGAKTNPLKAFRRNIKIFPEDFMFELSKVEFQAMEPCSGSLSP